MSTAEAQEKRIHRHLTIDAILGLFPHKAEKISHLLTSVGLHCVGCHAATWETLEAGMYGHGMDDEDIKSLVEKLNALLDEKVDLTTITLTPRAAKKYLEILAAEKKQGWGIRFMEKVAGCNGFEYILDYSEKPLPDDSVYESLGIEIHISKTILDRLIGSEIDYIDGLQGAGFKVTNPNVKSACGCGTSHGY